jgi:hypothetical protein
MASAHSQIKQAAWAFIALALVGWILALIGLAGKAGQVQRDIIGPRVG